MRVHETLGSQVCDQENGEPCKLDHAYYCRFCGDRFVVNEGTRYFAGDRMFASRTFPFDREECLLSARAARDSMALKQYEVIFESDKDDWEVK